MPMMSWQEKPLPVRTPPQCLQLKAQCRGASNDGYLRLLLQYTPDAGFKSSIYNELCTSERQVPPREGDKDGQVKSTHMH